MEDDMPTADRRPTKFRLALSGGRNRVKLTFATGNGFHCPDVVVAACCGTGFGTFFASARRRFIPVAMSALGQTEKNSV
jgi:hypothetical protein